MRKIDKLIVHCTDSDDSLDIGVREIRTWHLQRGWSDIGYHYVVRRDGTIERGRKDDTPGAHCKGHNSTSLGICWVGRRQPSPQQYESLLGLIRGLKQAYNLSHEQIFGHTELNPGKTCPNLPMDKIRAESIFLYPAKV